MDRLDAVTVFVAVAEQESFAAAARKLSRTPAAVTRAVAELEESLSKRLLNRTTRSVALTEAGQLYLERARKLLAAHAEFEGAAPDDREPSGMLHITAPVNFGRQHLMPLLCAFLEKYPRVDARVLLLDRTVSMVEEGLDVGVRLGRLPDSSLRATRAGTVKMGVYASPSYIARHGVPATPSELVQHRTIASGTINPTPDRWSFGGAGGVSHVAVKPRLIVNTTEAAADAAAAGLGLATLVSYQAAQHVAAGRLVEVLSEYNVEQIPIHVVQPAGRFTPVKVRAFIDEIGAGLRRKFG
jgi:DNA-binding transcriptional LysR family regulator